MNYSEKLKNPLWQKKRLEVLQRDDFTCQNCGDTKNTLHVHHRNYCFGFEPWEYQLIDLITLCEICHEDESDTVKGLLSDLNITLKRLFLSNEINDITNSFINIADSGSEKQILSAAIKKFLTSEEGMYILLKFYWNN